jgi:hypothetical protein
MPCIRFFRKLTSFTVRIIRPRQSAMSEQKVTKETRNPDLAVSPYPSLPKRGYLNDSGMALPRFCLPKPLLGGQAGYPEEFFHGRNSLGRLEQTILEHGSHSAFLAQALELGGPGPAQDRVVEAVVEHQ